MYSVRNDAFVYSSLLKKKNGSSDYYNENETLSAH